MQSIVKSLRFIFFFQKQQKHKIPYTSSFPDTQKMIQTNWCNKHSTIFAAAQSHW